jgi:hypothetical protein
VIYSEIRSEGSGIAAGFSPYFFGFSQLINILPLLHARLSLFLRHAAASLTSFLTRPLVGYEARS